jgi:shikimate kinase
MMTLPASHSCSLIFLVGFMGSGKTTVGQALARLMGWRFIDLDQLIEEREGQSIRAIFEARGEPEFRRIEHDAIAACREMNKTVIALGGGAFVADANRALIGSLGQSVWLDCPLEVCLERLGHDPTRPLLRGETEMRDLLERRRPSYEMADLIIHTGKRPPADVAVEIFNRLFS